MAAFLVVLGALGGAVLSIWIAARRFAQRQRELGRWDEYGPLVETEAPPSARGGGGRMNERLEVIGAWKGKVLRRRRPHEKP